MKKLLLYIGMCALGVIHTSSAYAPVAKHSAVYAPVAIHISGVSDPCAWVQQQLLQRYQPKPWPEETCQSPPVRIITAVSPCRSAAVSDYSTDPEFQSLYEETISFIKFHEGFAGGKAYYCAAGYKTIGYGHVVRPGEVFPEQISRREADRLLRRDFNHSIKSALRYSPQLTGCRLLAVAHFCFAKGPGNYAKSTLRKLVDSGQDPSEEFLRWCKYHKPNGTIVKSNYSRRIREWEVQMYNRQIETPALEMNPIDTISVNYISEI